MHVKFAGVLAVLSLTSVSLAQSDLPAIGFEQTDSRTLSFAGDPCGFVGSSTLSTEATLADGTIVQFTGQDIVRLASDGSHLMTLGSLPGVVFPSFVTVDPTESFAIVGESCNGDIFRVDLAGGGLSTLTNLFFNFDAVFAEDGAHVFVSASAAGTFGRNQIYRVNVADGTTTLKGRVAGFSGPLTLDAQGALYYATQLSGQPADILRWDAALLQRGTTLTEGNATLFAAGFDSASGLAFDPVSGNIVVNEFYALRLVGPAGTDLGTVATASPGDFFGNVEVATAGGTGSLQAFQPANCTIRYSVTDFFSFGVRRTAVPARPLATLTGATTGAATKTLTITGAYPNATILVYFNDVSLLNPAEYVFHSFGFPFHTSLPLNRSRRLRPVIAADALGTATFTYDDPGTLHGTLVFQAAIFDLAGETVGTTTYALN